MPENKTKLLFGKLITLALVTGITLLVPILAFAQEDPNNYTFSIKQFLEVEGQSHSYLEQGGIAAFITDMVNILSQIVGVITILILIVSGLLMITSGGNETQLAKGKDGFKYAIIGLLLAFTGYIITTFIQAIFYA